MLFIAASVAVEISEAEQSGEVRWSETYGRAHKKMRRSLKSSDISDATGLRGKVIRELYLAAMPQIIR